MGIVSRVQKIVENSFELVLCFAIEHAWPCIGAESWEASEFGSVVFVRRDLMMTAPDVTFYCDQEAFCPTIITARTVPEVLPGHYPWPVELRIDLDDSTWICPIFGGREVYLSIASDCPTLVAREQAEIVVKPAEGGVTLVHGEHIHQLAVHQSLTLKDWVFRATVAGDRISTVPDCVVNLLPELTSSGGDASAWTRVFSYLNAASPQLSLLSFVSFD